MKQEPMSGGLGIQAPMQQQHQLPKQAYPAAPIAAAPSSFVAAPPTQTPQGKFTLNHCPIYQINPEQFRVTL